MIWKQHHLSLSSDQLIILEKVPGGNAGEYQFHFSAFVIKEEAFILYIDKDEIQDLIKELQHLINE